MSFRNHASVVVHAIWLLGATLIALLLLATQPWSVARASALTSEPLSSAQAITTTVSVTSWPDPAIQGQPVTFKATVTAGGAPVPSGAVTFMIGGSAVTRPLDTQGTATYQAGPMPTGMHAVTVTYAGNASFSAGSALVIQAVHVRPNVSGGQSHTCSANSSGAVVCWGDDYDNKTIPPQDNSGFVQVSAGVKHTCGLKDDGSILCWGANASGQISVTLPNSSFVQVAAGGEHTCAVKADGTLACWGWNSAGQAEPPVPNQGFRQVSAGAQHNCALKADGSLLCWGLNDLGQATVPSPNSGFVEVSAGWYHTCARKTDGTLRCWGDNYYGQTAIPAPNSGFTQVSSGGYHACGLAGGGTLRCWGYNNQGQRNVPSPNGGFIQTGGGTYHNCAVKSDTTLRCWGANFYGQAPVVSLGPSFLVAGTMNFPYSETFSFPPSTGLLAPYHYSVISGTIPPGLTLTPDGVLSGMPATSGTFPFTVQMADAQNIAGTRAYSLLIKIANTTTSITSTLQASEYGQPITFRATITAIGPITPTGNVTFNVDGTKYFRSTDANGVATLTLTTLAVGSHTISASYAGDINFNPSNSGSISVQVARVDSSIQLVSALNPAGYSQPITFTVIGTSKWGAYPAGEVTFTVDQANIKRTFAANGQAVYVTNTLSLGYHNIGGAYAGNANLYAAVPVSLTQRVDRGATITRIDPVANPAAYQQPLTFTITVRSVANAIPTGVVTFTFRSTSVAATLNGTGRAIFNSGPLPLGAYPMSASYSGDVHYLPSSTVGTLQVARGPTLTSLASAPSPSIFGQSVIFTTTVTPIFGQSPTGVVVFHCGKTAVSRTLPASGVVSTVINGLPAGTQVVSSTYGGDANFAPSVGFYNQEILRAATQTTLSSLRNPSQFGQAVTFTAAVSGAPGQRPTGYIAFAFDGTTVTRTVNAGGVATYTTSTLEAGTHEINARYIGDDNFSPSEAPPLSQLVVDIPISNLKVVNNSPTTLEHPVTFTATASGSHITYQWDFGDGGVGPLDPSAVVTHVYTSAIAYTAHVTATNSANHVSAMTAVTITNIPPIANAGWPQGVPGGAPVTLDGSRSRETDGHLPLSYAWRQTKGTTVILSSDVISRPQFLAPLIPGSVILGFELTVADAHGVRSKPSQTTVMVNPKRLYLPKLYR